MLFNLFSTPIALGLAECNIWLQIFSVKLIDQPLLLVFKCSTAWPLCHLAVIVSFIVLKVMIVRPCRTDCAVELKLCSYPVFPQQYGICPTTPSACSIVQCTVESDSEEADIVHMIVQQWSWHCPAVQQQQQQCCCNLAFVSQFWSNVLSAPPFTASRKPSAALQFTGSNCRAVHCQGVNWLWCIRLWGIGVQILHWGSGKPAAGSSDSECSTMEAQLHTKSLLAICYYCYTQIHWTWQDRGDLFNNESKNYP